MGEAKWTPRTLTIEEFAPMEWLATDEAGTAFQFGDRPDALIIRFTPRGLGWFLSRVGTFILGAMPGTPAELAEDAREAERLGE